MQEKINTTPLCPQKVCKISSHPQKGQIHKILVQSASHRPVRKIDTAVKVSGFMVHIAIDNIRTLLLFKNFPTFQCEVIYSGFIQLCCLLQWRWNKLMEFIVAIYHGKKYGITIYHDVFNFLKLRNELHYCNGYIYSYTLHEVYIQTFNNQL